MPRTAENLPRHELIGLTVEVAESTDPGRCGVSGPVIDETRNTLVIETSSGDRTLPKAECEFAFRMEDLKVRVDGNLLTGRPEERISKSLPGKWGYVDAR